MIPTDLPVFELQNGPAHCHIADPRTKPFLLGSRYVHGGYVLKLTHKDELLSGFPVPDWDPYIGCGLPEVFETGLGFDACKQGDCYMRIGVGRVKRSANTTWNQSNMPLEQAVEWCIDEHQDASITMNCHDSMEISGNTYGYELVRELKLEPNTLVSRTSLKLTVPWSEPLLWFAHPFFAQSTGDGIGLKVLRAIKAANQELRMGSDGHHRFGKSGGFSTLFGAWGSTHPMELITEGNHRIQMQLNRPLDKLVCFATPTAFSVEPYISRGWLNDELADWELSYKWS